MANDMTSYSIKAQTEDAPVPCCRFRHFRIQRRVDSSHGRYGCTTRVLSGISTDHYVLQSSLHIQHHDRLPDAILEFQMEAVQSHSLDINQQAVRPRIDPLSADRRYQAVALFPLFDLHPVGM